VHLISIKHNRARHGLVSVNLVGVEIINVNYQCYTQDRPPATGGVARG
jgi:hypothetical protein